MSVNGRLPDFQSGRESSILSICTKFLFFEIKLRDRLMVGHYSLKVVMLVRPQLSQPNAQVTELAYVRVLETRF